MSWPEVTLGDHVELVSGPAFKSSRFTDNPEDIPLIKGDNIGQGRILWEKSKYWPSSDADSYSRFLLEEGDVVLAMDRPWVTAGLKFACISGSDPASLLVQRVARLRGLDDLSTRYLRYVVASNDFSRYVKAIMGGTNVPHISGDQIRAFKIALPTKAEQQSICEVLSSYDDLIENNRRRIQLLDQAARLLYIEWFVRLRFPGHEHLKVIDGAPEGWSRRPLGEVAPLNYGKALKKDNRVPGPYAVYGSSGIVGTHKKALVPGPGIIVGRKGNVGSVFWSTADFHPIDTVYYIGPDKSSLYLYYSLQHLHFINTDVAVPGLNRDFAHSRLLNEPEPIIVSQFEEFSAALHAQMDLLTRQNEALVSARDLLLPRLMNGEIAV